ncbi:hypothetical protein [Roseobacter sinensis]|uniref:Glycosyltransferase RgtA/B/C/D-like domain-containing protein n=1 Tax=Roseobacter sinensis TaxID=2931391 RepID=A0ABT3BJV4_9RHOB|nr:hypothetical protein [Roseobacter sp. WL0113]MCV3273855.1 hypothetical protein [Roseobacter sp. WL0113]
MHDIRSRTPLLTPKGVFLCLVLSLVLCWPIWAFSSHFVFADTASYFRGGGAIWKTLLDLLPAWDGATSTGPTAAATPAQGTTLTTDADGKSTTGRSFTYSALAYAAFATAGYWALPVFQAFIALLFVFALVDHVMVQRPYTLIIGFVLVASLTTLPWFSVYLMPDVFAGVIVLYGGLLLARYDELTPRQRVAFTLLAALAVTFHYGYPPLMAGIAGLVLFWRLCQRRLSVGFIAAALVPLFFAPLLNMAASSAVLGKASATPQRLPILLARSLEDGPAYWYLQEACPEAELALCELFGRDIPQHVGEFLWDDEGIESLSAEQMDRVREEEFAVLAQAFRAYPIAQSRSLLKNAAKQTVLIGTGNIAVAADLDARHRPIRPAPDHPVRPALAAFDDIVFWATWLLCVPLVLLAASGRLTGQHAMLVTGVLVGVLLNAGIFGGLSAPVERYQSRVIWVLPVLSVLFVSHWRARSAVQSTTPPRQEVPG